MTPLESTVQSKAEKSVLDSFIDCWLENEPSSLRTSAHSDYVINGLPLSVLNARVKIQEFPKILTLKPGIDGLRVRIDSSYFSYLFRGTVSDDDFNGWGKRNGLSTQI
jgi:hypothetical protein